MYKSTVIADKSSVFRIEARMFVSCRLIFYKAGKLFVERFYVWLASGNFSRISHFQNKTAQTK
jgi:hypothetical protein